MSTLPRRVTISLLALGAFGATALASSLVIDANWNLTGPNNSVFGDKADDYVVATIIGETDLEYLG